MLRASMFAAASIAAAAVAGCASGMRFSSVRPGVNQVVCVASGDRIFFSMDEDAASGMRWECTCDDPDVEVFMSRSTRSVRVEMRVHRGYDGPSAVTFVLKGPGPGRVSGRFTVTLFKRTGDTAFWE